MNKTILAVEGHKETLGLIRAALEGEGYRVLGARTLHEGFKLAADNRPDLILLEMVLPDGHGLELCRKVRASRELGGTPLIGLSEESELHRKKKGFEHGLDQYLTKPIETAELVMWVKALLRRVDMERGAGLNLQTYGDVALSGEARLLAFRGKCAKNLTKREYELFSTLIAASPRVFSRTAIIREIWKTESVENLVDTHIFNLRKKLPEELALRIRSVPGKGFGYFNNG
jgi:DNA-binding response OmpR family regulator